MLLAVHSRGIGLPPYPDLRRVRILLHEGDALILPGDDYAVTRTSSRYRYVQIGAQLLGRELIPGRYEAEEAVRCGLKGLRLRGCCVHHYKHPKGLKECQKKRGRQPRSCQQSSGTP